MNYSFTRRYSHFLCAVIFLVLSAVDLAADQTGSAKAGSGTAKDETAFRFYDLAERKATLVVKIGTLQRDIKDLEEQRIPEAERNERELADNKSRLDDLEKRETELKNQLKEILPQAGRTLDVNSVARRQSLSEDLSAVQTELKFRRRVTENLGGETSQNLKQQLAKKKDDLDEAQRGLNEVQREILKITTPEQSFKAEISIYSSILIGFVILGFFVTALFDSKVRQSVFSGQAGIQFLALFSIVIAIILFGITGILGGNELAALLGSISGYILGKVSAPNGATSVGRPSGIATAPGGLRLASANKGEVNASCSNVGGADSYIWYVKRGAGTTFDRVRTTSQPQATLSGFDPNEQIQVKVAAANAAGEGPASEVIQGSTGA
jgi:hypothetical protein